MTRHSSMIFEMIAGWMSGSAAKRAKVPPGRSPVTPSPEVADRPAAQIAPAIDLTGGDWCDFPVVGTNYKQDALISMFGKYTRAGLTGHCYAEFARETDNSHDANAIKVMIRGCAVGYFPREESKYLVGWMQQNNVASNYVFKCLAYLSGGSRSNQHDLIPYTLKINYKRPLVVDVY